MEKKKVRRYTRREVRRNRMIAFCCLVVLAILLIALIVWGIKNLVSGDDGKSSSESSLGTVSTFQSSSPDNASNSDSSLSGAVVSGGDSSADESASGASSSSSSSKVSSSTSTSSINSSDSYYESSMPLLVNPDHLMPDDYSPTVVSVGGNYKLESKAAAAWQDMQAAVFSGQIPFLSRTHMVHQRLVIAFGDDAHRIDSGVGHVGKHKIDHPVAPCHGQGRHRARGAKQHGADDGGAGTRGARN